MNSINNMNNLLPKEIIIHYWNKFPYPKRAVFKIGDTVRFCSDTYTIEAANNTGNGIEYALRGYEWLVWEEELS